MKDDLPFGQLPVLEIESADGEKRTVTQSDAILRYFGKLAGLYPKDEVVAMEVDEMLSIFDDLADPIILTVMGAVKALVSDDTAWTDVEKIAIRKRWLDQKVPKFMGHIENTLKKSSSGWLVGDSASIADLRFYCELGWFTGGILDGIPPTLLDDYPACVALMEKVKTLEGIKKWMDQYSKPYATFDFKHE